MMHVFSDSEEMVVAIDEADARAVMREVSGGDVWTEDVEIEQLPDDMELVLVDEDEAGTFETRKLCGEWAAEKGRGYLAGPVC